MTSFIIAGKNSDENKKKALEICKEKQIDQFDITLISSDKESLGIDLVKKLQEKVFLKPLRSKEQAIVIPDAQLLTLPAQNALLKLLEEPPLHTLLFLLTNNLESLLGTVRSRCHIIKIADPTPKPSEEENETVIKQYQKWTTQDIGAALKTAEQLAKDKGQALKQLEQSIIVGQSLLYGTVKSKKDVTLLAQQLKLLQDTHHTLDSTNTNPRLTLEHLFLSIRQSS